MDRYARALKASEPQWLPAAPLASRLVGLRIADPRVRLRVDETKFPAKALGGDTLGFWFFEQLPSVKYSGQDRRPKPWEVALQVYAL